MLIQKQLKSTILSDIREHQHTFLTQYVLEHGTEQHILELKKYWGNSKVSDSDQANIVKLFESTGALSYARTKVKKYLDKAKQITLEEKNITDQTRLALNQLIQYIKDRGY